MTRDPASIARQLTRAQRHALAQALQVNDGSSRGKWYLRLRVGAVVRRNLIARGLVGKRDGGFLTALGHQVRDTLVTDPLEQGRHHFDRGGHIARQVHP